MIKWSSMGKIQNSKDLAKSAARDAALQIAEAGLAAIDTETVVRDAVRLSGDTLSVKGKEFKLAPDGKLLVIGVGKCSLEAGKVLEKILGERLSGGIILTSNKPSLEIGNLKLEIRFGTHPFPTQPNVDATKKIIQTLTGLSEKDTVLFVISGGGSTLLCLPAIASPSTEALAKAEAEAGLPVPARPCPSLPASRQAAGGRSRAEAGQPQNFTYQDEANILHRLFEEGADIHEVNTLRKHTSLARGGWLARYAYPAQAISLIFSDVPSGALEFIASGPTVKDTTTVADARRVVEKYKITVGCGWDASLVETPKEDKYFKKVINLLAISNQAALNAMAAEAEKLNFTSRIMTANLRGEAREAAAAIVRDLAKEKLKTVLLYGGETTVTVRAPGGKGGRNLELALAALPALGPDDLILTLASDGRDNTNFAGAISDIITREHAEKLKLDAAQFLAENNSYKFFKATGDYLLTGDTGSNVSDLIVALMG
ncbi:hypothetical protein COU12_02680 [Candidatus Jorgensenbacteria bacterium CG10_big_fil_rev_8_21_14_0_10_54_38]|uniref:Glycerate kinase n=2 Tax=Candidatus Joergenseniibacteriota TaxID=1752739 RepID=A0A2M6WFG5_9BACT|nr:MAG: hypothetical protein COX26_02580 [Candidatus Jorgensenbacteria bacterium CG23_combo_of_CG06-09_8_20_14_all_54_14]PIT91519.1 MAG: hypothetical protein COU12_02680 [Candidatus Jorgensenbacteria bacterium CG10_big_fil_rev_8_21_14_0_10_54_38]